MHVLLLNLPNNGSNSGFRGVFYPLGIGYIAAALDQAGHTITVYDLQYDFVIGQYGEDRLREIINKTHYDVLCAGGVFFNISSLVNLTEISKTLRPDAPVIAGGSFCTSTPDIIFSNIPIDYMILGEGEASVVELLAEIDSGIKLPSTPGVMYRNSSGESAKTTPRPPETDLDRIAFPKRDILDFKGLYRKYFSIPNPMRYCAFMIASRGCVFSCTFCEPTFGKTIRVRTPENILEEIQQLQIDYDTKYIRFHDELILGGTKKNIRNFCEEVLRAKNKFFWQGTTNANMVDYDTLKLMKRANCFALSFGVESGSPTILKEMKKRNNLDHLKKVVKWCNDLGILVNFSHISGTPSETPETLNETREFLLDLNKHYWRIPTEINFLVPIPGSELYDVAKTRGLITSSDFEYIKQMQSMNRYSKPINLTSMDHVEHVSLLDDINNEVRTDYFRKHPRQRIRELLRLHGCSFKALTQNFHLRDLKPTFQSICWSLSKGQDNNRLGRILQRACFGKHYTMNTEVTKTSSSKNDQPMSMIGMNQF
jgi:radical SAM superfamily enzyme YgiQ (UPF0313 family)